MKEKAVKQENDNAAANASTKMSEKGNDLGLVKIHENVIASIVRKAVCGVDGVSRLAGSSFVDNIAEFVGSRKIGDRAIAIELNEEKVKIEVKIHINFGFRVPDVAAAVQSAVIEQVEGTTGMTVVGVNVVVQQIEEPSTEKTDKEEA